MSDEIVFVYTPHNGQLKVLELHNFSVTVGEWAAFWPNSIYFYGRITES